jgi:hypothetical protein
MLYLTKTIWRPFLLNDNLRKHLKTLLESQPLTKTPSNSCCAAIAYYNKSIAAFKLPETDRINNPKIEDSPSYIRQQHKMLPIEHEHTYTSEECRCWPTLAVYSWK